ncbi:hypothetical protein F2Q68_00036872 [Brassica cretica]|uniref:Uncharacterized protein n=1 Tax=Brassica cretica TaxID=69181 RepID=A0A8S9H053_BRACR|nr:hypothetical protein F2Q68_00036872 [Brassica cretica]
MVDSTSNGCSKRHQLALQSRDYIRSSIFKTARAIAEHKLTNQVTLFCPPTPSPLIISSLSLLLFYFIITVRASDPIKRYALSPNSIVVLIASLELKLQFEIHLVSWINIAVFRDDSARFNVKPMQLRPFDTIDTYASQSASPSFEIHLVSSVNFVEVTADLAVERYSPASSLSMRGESYPVFNLILNSSKCLSLRYFNVVSDYLKLF